MSVNLLCLYCNKHYNPYVYGDGGGAGSGSGGGDDAVSHGDKCHDGIVVVMLMLMMEAAYMRVRIAVISVLLAVVVSLVHYLVTCNVSFIGYQKLSLNPYRLWDEGQSDGKMWILQGPCLFFSP